MSLPAEFHNFAVYTVQVGLLVLIGALLPRAFRIRQPHALLLYWQLLLVTCLSLPLLAPRQVVSIPQTVVEVAQPAQRESVAPAQEALPLPAANWAALSWRVLLFVVFAGGAVRLGRLSLGLLRLRRLRRNARYLEMLPPGMGTLAPLTRSAAEILISTDIPGPATYGFICGTILLPERYERMEAGSQVSILCHELIHVRRRDWLFALAEQLILALFWFHPAVWWLVHRIELTREQVVDREVLALRVDRRQYLKSLLYTVGDRAALLSANLFLTRHHLKERVALLLEEVHMSRVRFITSLVCVALLFCVGAVVATHALPLTGVAVHPAPEPAAAPSSKPVVSPSPQPAPVPAPRPAAAAGQAKVVPVAPPSPAEAKKTAAGQTPINVVVVDINGLSIPGADIKIIDPETKNVLATGVSDERGRWNVAVSFLGKVDVAIGKPGFNNVAIKDVLLTGSAPTSLRTVLQPADTFAGRFVAPVEIPKAIPDNSQRTALAGIVVDPDKNPIPGVSIKVADSATGNITTGVTDERGTFRFVLPFVGKADVTFSQEGFKPSVIHGVTLMHATPVTLRGTLQLADGNETVVIRRGAQAVASGQPEPAGDRAIPARVISRVDPIFPDEAAQQGIEATVIVEAMVGADGNVSAVRIVKGHPLFDEAAMNAVARWRYTPALLNGQPHSSRATVTLVFRQ